jgi:hypothetical protein
VEFPAVGRRLTANLRAVKPLELRGRTLTIRLGGGAPAP